MQKTCIEENELLSRSKLWNLVKDFYVDAGKDAWDHQGVPFYITSNPMIAYRWAQIVFHYYLAVNRMFPSYHNSEPFYIFELGAGTGRFAYLFLKFFTQLVSQAQNKTQSLLPFKYVMCDLSPKMLDFWSSHPHLKPFIDAGIVDMARVDAAELSTITLMRGEKISSGSLSLPAVFLSGYFYDTLEHEAFRIGEEDEFELRFSSSIDANLSQTAAYEVLKNFHYEYSPFALSDNHALSAENEFMQKLLAYYRAQLKNHAVDQFDFTVPVGALVCNERIKTFSKEACLILSADQGFASFEDHLDFSSIELGRHGTISCPVNYEAYKLYEELKGSEVVLSESARHKLVECALFHSQKTHNYQSVIRMSQELFNHFDCENYWRIFNACAKDPQNSSLDELYFLLKLGYYDPINFFSVLPSLSSKLAQASPSEHKQWKCVFAKVLELFFAVNKQEVDLLLNTGALAFSLGWLDLAQTYFQKGLEIDSQRADLHFNLGLTQFQQGNKDGAMLCFITAEKLDPAFSLEARGLIS